MMTDFSFFSEQSYKKEHADDMILSGLNKQKHTKKFFQ